MNDGHTIPQLGIGVYKIPPAHTAGAVRSALECGYRHVDTAALYGNERQVGEALTQSGLARDEIFVTSKVWNDDHGYEATLRAFDASLDRLGLDYLDLYLIHWPAPDRNLFVETYLALETIQERGTVRSIGVSNFSIAHLERLLTEATHVPAINQIEIHPWLPQDELRAFNSAHGILTEAWSPLARGRLLDNGTLASIAEKHAVTPAQIVIRWHLDRGSVVIPKSANPERIRENFDVFDFALDAADHRLIAALASDRRTGANPDDVN